MTSTSPIEDISIVTLTRTNVTFDHSQKATKVCTLSPRHLVQFCCGTACVASVRSCQTIHLQVLHCRSRHVPSKLIVWNILAWSCCSCGIMDKASLQGKNVSVLHCFKHSACFMAVSTSALHFLCNLHICFSNHAMSKWTTVLLPYNQASDEHTHTHTDTQKLQTPNRLFL